MGSSGLTISYATAPVECELSLSGTGPRHTGDYLVACPSWDNARAFCWEHLKQRVAESDLFRAAWEEFVRKRERTA